MPGTGTTNDENIRTLTDQRVIWPFAGQLFESFPGQRAFLLQQFEGLLVGCVSLGLDQGAQVFVDAQRAVVVKICSRT